MSVLLTHVLTMARVTICLMDLTARVRSDSMDLHVKMVRSSKGKQSLVKQWPFKQFLSMPMPMCDPHLNCLRVTLASRNPYCRLELTHSLKFSCLPKVVETFINWRPKMICHIRVHLTENGHENPWYYSHRCL